MSNLIHTVIAGDDFGKLAILYYGTRAQYTKILNANSFVQGRKTSIDGLPLIYPGDVLVIPDVVTNFENNPETILASNENETAIIIDGERYIGFQNYEISLSFDSVSQFQLSFPWNPDNETQRELFRPYKEKICGLYIGGQKVIDGYIIKINPTSTQNVNVLNISGYGKPGILFDRNIPTTVWPLQINGLNLKQIAERICQVFGLTVDFGEYNPGGAFSGKHKVQIGIDEKPGDFLIKLAKERGFVITDGLNGELKFQKAGQNATFHIQAGRPPFVSSSGTTYDLQNRFSDITAVEVKNSRGVGSVQTVVDREIKDNGIIKPLVFKAKDNSSGNLQNSANFKLGRSQAEGIKFKITLEKWHKLSDNSLYLPGEIFTYQNDGDMIYNDTELLIKTATYKKNENTQIVELDCCFPECFSNTNKEVFPWQE